MDIQQILARFEKEAAGLVHCEPFSLASLFADCLNKLEDRLTDEEFEQLVRVGAGIYQCGVRECGQSVPVGDLLPASEWWAGKINSSLYQ